MNQNPLKDSLEQLALELRADAIAGRGKLPRGRDGRVSRAFLETTRELPREKLLRGAGGPTMVGDVLAPMLANYSPPARRSSVEQLEQLEEELAELLGAGAPRVWRDIRRPLYRLLRRARRELRAQQTPPTTH